MVKYIAGLALLVVVSAHASDAPPLELGVCDTVVMALENNPAFAVQRLGLSAKKTLVDEALSAFDPVVAASVSRSENSSPAGDYTSESEEVSVSGILPVGTRYELSASRTFSDSGASSDTDSAQVSLSVAQPLLRGAGKATGLVAIRQARLDLAASEHELRGYAESLVAQVVAAYWDLAQSKRELAIYEESLRLATEQLEHTEERIRLGSTAPVEAAAARAEVASRREALISARGNLAIARMKLLRLISSPYSEAKQWDREVILKDEPSIPSGGLDSLEEHLARALRSRSDLNAARAALQRGELELVKTKNGLLPKLDLFIALGRTGYANSFAGAFTDIGEGTGFTVGLSFERAIGNRSARSRHMRANISLEQARLALANLEQLVQLDVKTAYVAALTAREQIAATAATRELKEETFRGEEEKFRVGRSTSFQVAQAQRDYTASRVAELGAVVRYIKALMELHRLDGTLLERMGVRYSAGPD